MKFGEIIKNLRESSGMTQEELATAVGAVNKSYISKIENGSRSTPISMVKKFASVFHVSPGMLLDEMDPSNQYLEFLPYLAKADEGTLTAIRKLLDMPEKRESLDSSSTVTA